MSHGIPEGSYNSSEVESQYDIVYLKISVLLCCAGVGADSYAAWLQIDLKAVRSRVGKL